MCKISAFIDAACIATFATIKEFVKFSNIQREALPEIETAITSYMMEAKKDYQKSE